MMLKPNQRKMKPQNIEKGRFNCIQMNGDYSRDWYDRFTKVTIH